MAKLSLANPQDVPILKTKLYPPPPRPDLVPRPHLIERMDEGLHLGHKLTLISAPAGFGKTTLIAEDVLALLDDLAYGSGSTRGLQKTRQRWTSRLEAKKAQRPLSELRAIARELGVAGRSRMRRAELPAAIERVAPGRLE